MDRLFRHHFYVFHLVFLGLCAWVFAKTSTGVMAHFLADSLKSEEAAPAAAKGKRPPSKKGRNFDLATEVNIFAARREKVVVEPTEAGAAEKKGQERGDWRDATATSLRAQLVGTAVFPDPTDSLASIIDLSGGKNASANTYSINDCPEGYDPDTEVDAESDPDGALVGRPMPCNRLMKVGVIRRIEEERVVFFNEDASKWEYLAIAEDVPKGARVSSRKPKKKDKTTTKAPKGDELGAGIRKVNDTSYEVEQGEIDKVMANLSSLATQARIVPAFEGGKPVGFKLFSIRPNSLYSKIGIKNGDVITRINGYEITSPDKALEIYQKLKDAKNVTVDLKRRGAAQTIDYTIKQ
jgi:general secretion pathway protein C